LTIDQVSSMLLILELEGKIQVQAGGRYSRPQASDNK
jgi:predicted Rossmann fold nucleotide-binding protein DprA/Smf involved in DNA uptake